MSLQDRPRPELSLVVPVYNEEAGIAPFLDAVAGDLRAVERFEVIFVDDGSSDATAACVLAERERRPFPVELLRFSRNFGKEAATTAGLDHARGRAVVPIDVDLQDPPALIDQMVARWRDGDDVVLAVRAGRPDDAVSKRLSARLFYRLANRISDSAMPENAGDFRLLDEKVVRVIRQLRERNRFMKGLLSWPGFCVGTVTYTRPQRAAGASKWRPHRLFNFALDGIFGFSTVPLRLWTYLGLLVSASAFGYLAFVIGKTLITGVQVPGYASTVSFILFFNGLTLLGIGVVGEYVGRIFNEVKARPIYVLRESTLEAAPENAPENAEAGAPAPLRPVEDPAERG